MNLTNNKSHSGLTLVELIIASTIGLIMLMMIANLSVSIFRTRAQLQTLNAIQDTTNLILNDLRDNIRWSSNQAGDQLPTYDGTTLFVNNSSTLYTYNSSTQSINKDGTPLNPPTTQISSFSITPINGTAYLPMFRIQFTIKSTINPHIELTPNVIFTNKRQRYGP